MLDEGFSAYQARFPSLGLVRCRIGSPADIALDLDRVQVDGSMYINGSQVTAATHHFGVRMIDARIGGNLFCGGVAPLRARRIGQEAATAKTTPPRQIKLTRQTTT